MKTGESVTDSQGTTWTVGQELGRGSFARRFVARDDAGREAVLTTALQAADLFGDEAEALAQACSAIVAEQATWMGERRRSWLPDLIDTFTTPSGARAVLMPRAPATLDARIRAGAPLGSLLDALIQVADHVTGGTHGNLHPASILLYDDGVRLADPVTPALREHGPRLAARAGARTPFLPPEAQGEPEPRWDTYAICHALYSAASLAPASADGRREDPPALPREGLDKVALSAVKDRVHARLQQERANPRFAGRLADKLGAVLNRGLSAQAAPSPPYRFDQASELRDRLSEVHALVDPGVTAVGKVLLAAEARDHIFEGGDTPSFSTTVTVSAGVTHEDVASGLLVRDLDAEGDDRVPVPDARYSVKPHPSGRLRFDFALPELRPGRYTVRVAFTVKDSGHEPSTTDGHFEVRPPPGYVPPPDEPEPQDSALRFPGPSPTGAPPELDEPLPDDDLEDDEDDGFPSPIRPSDPDVLGTLGARPATTPGEGPSLRAVPTPTPSFGPAGTAVPTDSSPDSESGIPSIAPSAPGFEADDDAAPGGGHPDITAKAPEPPPAPAWGEAGEWAPLPDDAPLPGAADDPLPNVFPGTDGMQDLPSMGGGRPADGSVGALVDQALAVVRDNTWIALGALVGALVLLLAAAGLIVQSCG